MSTTTYAPPVTIDGPAPVAPPYNVFTVAELAEPLDPNVEEYRWIGGGQLYGYPPGPPSGFDPCSTGSERQKNEGETAPIPKFGTFTAYLAEACTMSGATYAEFERRLAKTLRAIDAFAAERQLIRGDYLSTNPYLTDLNVDVLAAGAALPARTGLSYLENAIAATGRLGVIHASPATVIAWADCLLFGADAPLRTRNGTPVVAGYGYVDADDPIHPFGEAAPGAGQDWAFATGPLVYRRGRTMPLGDDVSQSLSRELNDLVVRAERDLFIAWDTALQATALIDWSP